MKEKKKFWTLRYILINVTYYAAFCTIHAYAAVYLLEKGFSNTEIGILLAIANILSAILQPIVAGIIDRPGRLTNRISIIVSSLFIMLASLLLYVVNDNRIIIFIVFMLIYMIQFVYQPIITALYFEYEKAGADIKYGLSRGLGSVTFAILSALMGGIVDKNGANILLIANIVIMALAIIVTYFFKIPDNENNKEDLKREDEKANGNIIEFIKQYPNFSIFILATICFFFSHNMVNDFLYQIIVPLGGTKTDLGYATFLAAVLELPTMAAMGVIIKKISVEKMLVLSGIFFGIKTFILAIASNMAMVYMSQACQILAYAVFIPASAYYVNKEMKTLDQVKGQAYITSAITIGGVFSNLFSGHSIDKYGTSPTIYTGAVVAFIGVVIAFVSLIYLKRRENTK